MTTGLESGISRKTSHKVEMSAFVLKADKQTMISGVPGRHLSQCRFSCRSRRTRAGRSFSGIVMLSASVLFAVLAACLLPSIHGSAIPMWEYLSRGEKMSHLFNLFVQQVEKHCASRPEPDCSKLLLVYGLTNLAKMEDESLDGMDPYQRGANEIVWDSMMKGSSKHNHVNGYATKSPSTPSSIGFSSTPNSIDSAKDVEDLEASDPGSLEAASNLNLEEAEPQSFLLGPMVVRVLPNGMPIPGEKNQLPKDEDIEELAPTRFRSYSISQQPNANKLGYEDPSLGLFPSRYHQNRHEPTYSVIRRPYDTFRLEPPSYPLSH